MTDEKSSDISVIYCTAPSTDSTRIARELLERRLVACVNITPVRSLYRWEGHLCDEKEDLLIIKTSNHCIEDLITVIRTIHPYEVPEIITLRVSKGFSGYIDWVINETV